jgi:DNA-binding CsgD family transcriptional regulator
VAGLLESAAVDARGRGAAWTAGELFEMAFNATDPDHRDDRIRRALAGGGCFITAAESDRAVALVEQVAQLVSADTSAEYQVILGDGRRGNVGFVEASYRRAVTVATPGTRISARAHSELAVALRDQGRLRDSLAMGEHAAQAARQADDFDTLLYALTTTYVVQVRGLIGDAESTYRTISALLAEPRARDAEARSLIAPMFRAAFRLDSSSAADIGDRLVAHAASTGDLAMCLWLEKTTAGFEVRAGDLAAALRRFDRIRVYSHVPEFLPFVAEVRTTLATHMGDTESARAWAKTAIAGARERGSLTALIISLGWLATAEIAAADWSAAIVPLRELHHIATEYGFHVNAYPWQRDFIEAAVRLGALDEARQVLEEMRTVADRTRFVAWDAMAVRGAALIAAHDGDVETAVATAATLLDRRSDHTPLEYGRTLLTYGTLARRAKKRGTARDALAEAFAIFTRLESVPWQQRARDELQRVGLRATDNELTATEQRVARLVASGCSNKQTADQLHLAVKTVEYLLTSIYRKLRIRSRTELAARYSIEASA